MHGLGGIVRANNREAAKHFRDHYAKLRAAAEKRGNWKKARLYDRIAADFQSFMDGEITVWPDKKNREAGLLDSGRTLPFPPAQ